MKNEPIIAPKTATVDGKRVELVWFREEQTEYLFAELGEGRSLIVTDPEATGYPVEGERALVGLQSEEGAVVDATVEVACWGADCAIAIAKGDAS